MVAGEARPVVLVVEDELMIRMGATALVEDLGYEYFEASSADEAIELLEQHPQITIGHRQVTKRSPTPFGSMRLGCRKRFSREKEP